MQPNARVLPADVYDALELVALEFGGIGAGHLFATSDRFTPLCAHGCGIFAEFADTERDDSARSVIRDALYDASLWKFDSDAAVNAINLRRGAQYDSRVPFSEWCAELGVVRGDA